MNENNVVESGAEAPVSVIVTEPVVVTGEDPLQVTIVGEDPVAVTVTDSRPFLSTPLDEYSVSEGLLLLIVLLLVLQIFGRMLKEGFHGLRSR